MVTLHLSERDYELKYSFADEVTLQRRCNGLGTLDILERLSRGDAQVLVQCLSVGLGHGANKKLQNEPDQVIKLINAAITNGTSKSKLTNAIVEAFQEAGIITKDDGKDKDEPAA